jgi:hypothetical protein
MSNFELRSSEALKVIESPIEEAKRFLEIKKRAIAFWENLLDSHM